MYQKDESADLNNSMLLGFQSFLDKNRVREYPSPVYIANFLLLSSNVMQFVILGTDSVLDSYEEQEF